jgi:hypothetical protein
MPLSQVQLKSSVLCEKIICQRSCCSVDGVDASSYRITVVVAGGCGVGELQADQWAGGLLLKTPLVFFDGGHVSGIST